jgi:hypothetical protein
LKLQVRKVKDGEFAVEGKAWKQGTTEPEKWLITHTEKTETGKEPNAGARFGVGQSVRGHAN